jgi:hypothetical protein
VCKQPRYDSAVRKRVGIACLAVATLVPAGTVDTAAATQAKARLSLLDAAPLSVGGTSFLRGERVLVTATVGGERHTRRIQASTTGRFRVAFAAVTDRCVGGFVTAVGSRGSRATLKLPQPACPPPL